MVRFASVSTTSDALSKEELMSFDPQTFLMQNLEYFASLAIQNNDRYRYVLPVVGSTPSDISQFFFGCTGH